MKGDVVVVPFPFSDLTEAKRRPALIVAVLEGDDLLLCQITSQRVRDSYAIPLEDKDFEVGGLRQKSNIRPNRLFTADQRIVLYKAGHLKNAKIREVIRKIVEIVQHRTGKAGSNSSPKDCFPASPRLQRRRNERYCLREFPIDTIPSARSSHSASGLCFGRTQ